MYKVFRELPSCFRRGRTVLTLSGSSPATLATLLDLIYPPMTFGPKFKLASGLVLPSLAAVSRLASALQSAGGLRQCEASLRALAVVPPPGCWDSACEDPSSPRYLLGWLETADVIPDWAPILDALIDQVAVHFEGYHHEAMQASLKKVSPETARRVNAGYIARLQVCACL